MKKTIVIMTLPAMMLLGCGEKKTDADEASPATEATAEDPGDVDATTDELNEATENPSPTDNTVAENTTPEYTTPGNTEPAKPATPAINWTKPVNGTWVGTDDQGTTRWYKLDKANSRVVWSVNGKDFVVTDKPMWPDKNGHLLKVEGGKLMWTANNGQSWSEVPGWKWQGTDGKWYKFDKDWNLWAS